MVELTKHVRTRIRYDGPALAGHEMDVQDLAPALLAMAEIVQIANRKFNGDAVAIRVMVDADVEQQCFQLDLSLVQTVMSQAATLLGQKEVATAKEIAEWIGIISGSGFGLFSVLKWIHGKGDKPAVTFKVGDQAGTTIINIAGDAHGLVVPTPTAKLLVDQDVQKNVRNVLKPLELDGYEDLTFLYNEKPVTRIEKDEALNIRSAPPIAPDDAETESASRIRGSVRIKSPQYEGGARWSLLYQGRAIDAEMADEAAKWVADFQCNRIEAPPNTVLEVTMTETVRLNAQGMAMSKPAYVVHEVHSVTPPLTQQGLPF